MPSSARKKFRYFIVDYDDLKKMEDFGIGHNTYFEYVRWLSFADPSNPNMYNTRHVYRVKMTDEIYLIFKLKINAQLTSECLV